MLKVWRLAFETSESVSGTAPSWRSLTPVWLLVGASILLALGAGRAYEFAEATAQQLLDQRSYVGTVLSELPDSPASEVPES
jgi:hypothetical protein